MGRDLFELLLGPGGSTCLAPRSWERAAELEILLSKRCESRGKRRRSWARALLTQRGAAGGGGTLRGEKGEVGIGRGLALQAVAGTGPIHRSPRERERKWDAAAENGDGGGGG